MEQSLVTEELIITLLLIVALVAIAVRRLRLPYTVALIVVGLLITFRHPIHVELTPALILALFLPPMVFEAAFHLELGRLQAALLPIIVFSIPGVLLTAGIVGVIVALGTSLPLATALVFGTLIAATDPVSVVALFRTLGAPRSLTLIVESESLFNDGTAIVLFSIMLGLAIPASTSGADQAASFSLLGNVFDFIRIAGGGILVGLSLGWLIAQLIARIDDHLIETTLTTVLAFGAYLIAEQLHVSGVLAVVGAGIINGNLASKGMSPTTRMVLFNFWEYVAFAAMSLVFLLIGLDVNPDNLTANVGPIVVAIVAVLISRAVVVYGLSALLNLRTKTLSLAYQHVLFWGGLRGAVGLALVLSLPTNFPDRDLLSAMTYGVVLFTVLIQGITMRPLLRRLGLVQQTDAQLEYERRHGRLMASRAARERLEKLHNEGLLSMSVWESIATELDQEIEIELAAQHELMRRDTALHDRELADARREGLRAQRVMLTTLLNDGAISEPIFDELVAAIDASLMQSDLPSSTKIAAAT